jgi:hypothetical protein
MRFLVIDDKDDELEQAKIAAKEKGIEILTLNPNHKSEYLELTSWPKDWLKVRWATGDSEYPPAWYDAVRHLVVDGIVTDLIWELSRMDYMEPGNPKVETLPETPYGLLVHIEATKVGKPVVICTDAQGHAGQSAAGWVLDYACDPACPIRVERGKGWGKAFDMLIAQIEEAKK